ncbi:MAG: undecaprenyl-phosphate glucose phosphotransferase [Cytophagales bacterium]|nr:MAG: undecaprenyl-phosphate glucose phosphotransferase [Cytophagales bacterium]
MIKGLSRFIKAIHLTGDLLLLNFAFWIAYILKFHKNPIEAINDHYVFLHLTFNSIWLILILVFKIYNIERVTRLESIIINLTKTILTHALFVFGFIASINAFYYSRKQLLYTYIIFGILVLSWRFLAIYLVKFFRSLGGNYRNVVIVGAGAAGNQIYNYIKNDLASGYKFAGFFDDNPQNSLHKSLVVGNVNDVKLFALENKVNEIFCALPLTASKNIRELISFCDDNFIRFRMIPDFRGFLNKKVNIDFYNIVPVITLRTEPLELISNRIFKRIFDFVFSFLIIVTFFPILFPIFILLIKLSSKGPIFFKQKRSGRRNEEFYCYKFRSMTINLQSDSQQAIQGDARVTPIGRFLRKSNLDELPQFFNVLIGNMSVVGPRPHMLKHTEEYSRIIDKYMVRHLVKPGITGWAQVNGYRGTTINPRYMMKRVQYDLWYIENWSFLLDMKIIFLTAFNMIKGEKNAV